MAVKYLAQGEDFSFPPVGSASSSYAADIADELERFGRVEDRRAAMPGLGVMSRRRVPGLQGVPGAATSIAAKPRKPVQRSGVPTMKSGGKVKKGKR